MASPEASHEGRTFEQEIATLKKAWDSEKRSAAYWADQRRLAETGRLEALRRTWMLTERLAAYGLLDEAGIRDSYTDEFARQTKTAHDAERLETFRRDMVQLMFEAEEAESNGVPADVILAAALKAMRRNINRAEKKTLSMAAAREQAVEYVASIPVRLPRAS